MKNQIDESKSIFAVGRSGCKIHDAKFYSTRKLAQKSLKAIADERRRKLGVRIVKDTDDVFEFLFGWEEARVCFKIIEIGVDLDD